MTKRKKDDIELAGMPFEEALSRLIQTDPAELATEFASLKTRQQRIRNDAEETKNFIERGGKSGGKRFRL